MQQIKQIKALKELALSPIVSNIGKYLSNIVALSGKYYFQLLKHQVSSIVLKGKEYQGNTKLYHMTLKFYIKKISLDETLAIILKKICNKYKIETNISRKAMKELLLLCTNTYISNLMEIYIIQIDLH